MFGPDNNSAPVTRPSHWLTQGKVHSIDLCYSQSIWLEEILESIKVEERRNYKTSHLLSRKNYVDPSLNDPVQIRAIHVSQRSVKSQQKTKGRNVTSVSYLLLGDKKTPI